MKRKKILLFVLLLLCVLYVPNVLAANIKGCESILPGVKIDVKIANVVHNIVVVIKVVVPVLLVIFGMLDLFKGITAQKEDEIKKGQNIFIKRLITAAIIFFVISIVQLLISFIASDEPGIMTCANCFINGANSTSGACK
jgi:hypothetical protein